jgi:hypothetical protein
MLIKKMEKKNYLNKIEKERKIIQKQSKIHKEMRVQIIKKVLCNNISWNKKIKFVH